MNGTTVNHPAVDTNLIQAFGKIPDDWAPFTRTPFANAGITLGVYEKPATSYILSSDGQTWQDNWSAVPMTDEEIARKQNNVIQTWANRPFADNFTAWTLDKTTCTMVPPTPRPTPPDGQAYRWNGKINDWQIASIMPSDGQNYTWNFDTWTWDVVS